ncbi:MAG: tetratricopeptide repeat protein [Termitinemataceae bacterium]|nr:MAG: tetratricopeptide repeat protein [Termitinemataceae bacterium]
MLIIPILLVVVIISSAIFLFWFFKSHLANVKPNEKRKKNVNKDVLLKNALKKLEKSPRDCAALLVVAENYYESSEWTKAFKSYETIADIPEKNSDVDDAIINFRAAECALKLKMPDAAYRYSVVAHSMAPSNADITLQLSTIEFERKNYEKAAQFAQQAYTLNPDSADILRMLGHAYFKMRKIKEAMVYIRKAIDLQPNDKESMFMLAECYDDAGQVDQALRIYTHLRPDPTWGPEACLRSGLSKVQTHQDDPAITDFEIGLHHKVIKPDIEIELHYQIGSAFLRMQHIGEALQHLTEIFRTNPEYKDVDALINKYKELNASKNLQIFIMSPNAEFTALCRKIVLSYYPKAKSKITKTQVSGNEYVDIVAEIDTPKWSDIVMFRFIRSQGSVGELVLRDFHSRLKDAKAGKGICVSVGKFSDEAKRFTEARLIDLIDKEHFTPILNKLDNPEEE